MLEVQKEKKKKILADLSLDLRRAPKECFKKRQECVYPPYSQWEIPPPCISRGDLPLISWNGW